MSWRNRWVVLVPGEVAWVERRARELLDELEQGAGTQYTVLPGRGRYQALVQEDSRDIGPEVLLGHALSLECQEPVYSIEGREEFAYVCRFLKGEEARERRAPEELVRALGCEVPWGEEPPLEPYEKKTCKVVLIQGLSVARVRKALDAEAGRALPEGYHRIEETPQGVLLTDGTGPLVFAHNFLAERFPRATLYTVIATPSLDYFVVFVSRSRKTVQFVPPPDEPTFYPPIHDVLGERTPEAILAALGIPREWFRG